MKRVLLLCTGNSCRSQMAEALWRRLAGGTWDVASAGTEPTGIVHPLALRALEEIGVPLVDPRSKSLEEFAGHPFDLVVTVCDGAREACQESSGVARQEHWPIFDPAQATGSDESRMAVFRRVRDEIAARIRTHLDADRPAEEGP